MNNKSAFTSFCLLFSFSTWICCVLPISVMLIAGSQAVVALVVAAPWLVTLSFYKDIIFVVAGCLLAFNSWLLFHPYFQKECPSNQNASCKPLKKTIKIIYIASVLVYVIGFFFSYLIIYVYPY